MFGVSKISVKPGYRPQAQDLSPEADAFDFMLLRQRSCPERLQMASKLMRGARQLSLHCLKQSFSYLNAQEFRTKIALAWLQEDCPPEFLPLGDEMTWIQDSIGLAIHLHAIFQALEIPCYITGGLAAIAYGEPRTTRNVDMVVRLNWQDLDRLITSLETQQFYISGVEAVRSGQMKMFQITHQITISRADLILSGSEDFDRNQFDRRG